MSLTDSFRDLLQAVPVNAVLRERIASLLEHAAHLERRVSELEREAGKLQAQLEDVTADRDKHREEHQRLEEIHAEEVLIHRMIEFRRGKRTGGKWMAFCPRCHLPAGFGISDFSGRMVHCPAKSDHCGWLVAVDRDLDAIIAELG